jgi:rare lipoprotein A
MRKILLSYLITCFCLFSCAREKSYVKIVKRPPSKSIMLPETKKGKLPKPYVINGKRYYPLPNSHGFVQFGKASWYGKKFHGRTTANGEVFNMYKKSAAHKTLPMNTYVRVLHLANGKSTVVRINDRGPFVKGRVIDLSYAAAKEIGLLGPGVVDVKVVALGREIGELKTEIGSRPLVEWNDLKEGEFTVQVGAFQNKGNALGLADRLKVIFEYVNVSAYVDENKTTFYRVHVSKSKTLMQAGEIEKKLEEMGFTGAFIVRI